MPPERSLFPQLRKLVEDYPRLTTATLRAGGVWRGGLRASVKVRQHRAFSMDELRHLGGSDSGPNPMEHFLSSLAGCVCIITPALAQELEMEIQGLQVQVEGSLDVRGFLGQDGIRPAFSTVKVHVRLKTRESQEQANHLKEEFERRCPFHYMLVESGASLDSRWEAVPPRRGKRDIWRVLHAGTGKDTT